MAVRRVRVLKRMPVGKTENHIELMNRLLKRSRLLKKNPKMEAGKLSEADFIKELATMKKEGERPKRFMGGTNLRDRHVVSNIQKWKKEREAVNKHK